MLTSRFRPRCRRATRQKIAAEIRNPTVDIWTGASDRTLRKLSINLNVPVSGTISSLLGGLSSAQVAMTLEYANLNQPQTVATPTNVRPFSQFTAQLRGIIGSIQGSLGAGGLGGDCTLRLLQSRSQIALGGVEVSPSQMGVRTVGLLFVQHV